VLRQSGSDFWGRLAETNCSASAPGERGLLARSCRQLAGNAWCVTCGSVESCDSFGKLPKLTGWQPVLPRNPRRGRSVLSSRASHCIGIILQKVRDRETRALPNQFAAALAVLLIRLRFAAKWHVRIRD
jgi:hypothetical protein